MKIAIFTDSYKPNTDGVATVTKVVATEMLKRGHKITIVCPGNNTEIVKEKGMKIIRIKSHSVKLYREHKICFKTPEYVEKLEDFSSYDLIHMQTNMTIPLVGCLIALKYNLPISCTFHTNIADFATSFFKKDVMDNVNNPVYKIMSNPILLAGFRAFAGSAVWNLTKDFHNAVPNTTVPSRFCRYLLRKHGVKNPIIVLNNPVNPTNSKKNYEKKYKIKNKFVLLHVGRLSVEKRVHLLIETIAKLKNEIPNIHGIICSDGPLRKNLEKLAKKLKVTNNITFTGFIPRDELSYLYENCSILTAFGLYETFNLCATEGLYYSKPIIISDAGPHSELINNNGFLVKIDKNEVNNLANSAKVLYENKKLYSDFCKQSKKMWKHYDFKTTIDKHEAYFINSMSQNIISNKNYFNFIKYVSGLSIAINTLLFSLSLKFKGLDKMSKSFENFRNKISENISKFKKSF